MARIRREVAPLATALWLPPLVSLAPLDAILITLALVLSRVHRRLADGLRAA